MCNKLNNMKRRLPPLNALRAFEAAARLGRMTSAAEELSVTPGAISRQVRQLEAALGVALFEGSRNKPQLTPAGVTLLPGISAALDQMDSAVRAVRCTVAGTLDVCCYSTFTVKWLIPRLYGFNALHPDIEIRLSAADRARELDTGRFDLLITAEDRDSAKSPTLLPLFAERLGPVMAPSLAAASRIHTAQDLAGQTLLHTATRPDAWQMWCQSRNCTMPYRGGPEFEHYYFTLEAAIGGLGICIAPWHLVMDDVKAGRLVAPLGFDESAYQYVARRRSAADVRLDPFCSWLEKQALDMPAP
jgi:LysR family glycine cleavage system transcriptional activator